MFKRNSLPALLSAAVILSTLLAACAPAVPQTIIQTVEVMVAGTPVVQTQVVEVTAAAPQEDVTRPLMAEGLVPCNPIPEMPEAASHAAPFSASVQTLMLPAARLQAVNLPQGERVYRVGVAEDVTSINPWYGGSTSWDAYMLPPVWTLYTRSEKYFTYIPNLAEDLPEPLVQEGDFWVVTIPLRQDVRWNDGTPVTAHDVAFTANTAMEVGQVLWSSWFDQNYLLRLEAVDDYAVKIIYHTKPGLARHEEGTLFGPILNAAYWELKMEEAGVMETIEALPANASEEDLSEAQSEAQSKLYAIDPDGEPLAGSYQLEKWEKGAYLVLAANPDWADRGLVVEQWDGGGYRNSRGFEINIPEREPDLIQHMDQQVDSIVFTIYGTQDAAILAMQNGEVDFMLRSVGLEGGLGSQLKTDPRFAVIQNPSNGYRYLSFNTRRRPMNDCSFRQAVAVLIDKEFLTGTILQGMAFPVFTFVPPGNAAWYSDAVPKLGMGLSHQQRTDLAREILKQAGYSWEGGLEPLWDEANRMVTQAGRLLMPDGTPVPPLIMPAPSAGYDPMRSTFAIWIETWLNEFGIPLQADLAGFNEIVPTIFTEQDFDMFILGWSLSIFPSYLYDFFAEEQSVVDGNNAGGYVNPQVEAKLKEILTCESFTECRAISDELQVILATEQPYVLLFDTGVSEIYRSDTVEYPYTEQLSGLQCSHLGGQIYPSVLIK